jgi:dihydroxyacetone kinase-like predicted kinase
MTGARVQTVHSLDGNGFAQALHAGTLAVVAECDNLDRINVFPVADAARSVAAEAALDGARGNSGAIFAQFLGGLAESFSDRPHVGTREFADGAGLGSQAAWNALQNPREGTILSVLRAWSHELAVGSARTEDFADALGDALQAARHALAETPRQLAVLARHRVVDAGGQGFVYFLEGVLDCSPAPTTRSTPPTASAPRRSCRAWPSTSSGSRPGSPRWATRWSWPAEDRGSASTCTPTRLWSS